MPPLQKGGDEVAYSARVAVVKGLLDFNFDLVDREEARNHVSDQVRSALWLWLI